MHKPLLSVLSCFLAILCGLQANAAVGDTFEYNGIYYTILDEAAKTVETKAGVPFSTPGHSISGPLTLTETVKYNGSDYTLTKIGNYSFYNCKELTGDLVIPNTVTEIGDWAFYDCRGFTGSLMIGKSVTTIGEGAFSECSGFTGSLVIPNSVVEIGSGPFDRCIGLTEIKVAEGNKFYKSIDGVLFNKDVTELIQAPAGKQCQNYSIPSSVTEIGEAAFNGCSGFAGSLSIPNSVTTIGDWAFLDCRGFTGSLTIGNSVIEIGTEAFHDCSGFTGSLTIPNSVTVIGEYAFSGCSGLTGSLTIGNSVTTIGYSAFSGCSGFTGSLIIPNSVTKIEYRAFYGCSGFTGSLTIPNSVTTIYDSTFCGCSGFTGSLTIPNSVTEIGFYAFEDCSGFDNIFLPTSVESIYNSSFYGCKKANLVTLNRSLTIVEDGHPHFPYRNGDSHPTYYALGETVDNLKAAIDYVRVKPFLDPIFNDATGKEITILRNGELVIEPVAHAFGPASGLQFDMTLPEGLTLTAVEAVGVQALFARQQNGDYRVLIFNMQSLEPLGDLELGFTFTADESLKDGELKVHDVIHSIFGQEVLGDDETVKVTVLVGNGDANGDGIVNIADVIAIANQILGKVPEDFNFELADVNRDGKISIVDLTEVINKVLSQPKNVADEPNNIVARVAALNHEIDFGQPESLGDDRYLLPLLLSPAMEYAGIQFDIDYPDDVVIESITLGPTIPSSHTLYQSDVTGTTKRAMIFSMMLTPFPTEPNTVLVNIIVKGKSSSKVISVNSVAASDADARNYFLNDAETTMGVVTGVESVTVDSAAERRTGVYDLYGRRYDDRENLAPGVYVIDGVKTIVK